uniref:LRRCT domain-containing protein n=1 Tax=Enterobius vermicularis TaxID=51028 RepID=A0A0N4UYC6_ENTVE
LSSDRISKLPRATHLDLSANSISVIPPEFCLLTHITHLELASNRLHSLPENFGNLSNLNHLDLYKNYLEVPPVLYALWTGELPLSFGNLSNLKWLDLKDNPLQNDISKVCGDCSDDKGCRAAATDVVQYMRQKIEANAEKSENAAQKEKATKKKKKKLKERLAQQADEETVPLFVPKGLGFYKPLSELGYFARRNRLTICLFFMT